MERKFFYKEKLGKSNKMLYLYSMKEIHKDDNYKEVDGEFYLRELQPNGGGYKWIQIITTSTNIGNKKNISTHGSNRSNRLGR